jgi:hypothetical protein
MKIVDIKDKNMVIRDMTLEEDVAWLKESSNTVLEHGTYEVRYSVDKNVFCVWDRKEHWNHECSSVSEVLKIIE